MNQHGGKILLIEDSLSSIALIRQVLQQTGYQVYSTTNPLEGLQHAEVDLPELILLDIVLPDIDGFECCRRLKSNPATQNIPIIFVTARVEQEYVTKGFELGAADYLTKPFHPNELLSRVQSQIQIQRSRRLLEQQNLELNQALSTRDKFFSLIAHDLRTPIGIQQAVIAQLLIPGVIEDADQREEFLDILGKSSTQLTKLLDNLLIWATNQVQGVALEPETLTIQILTTDIITLLEPVAAKKSIRLQVNIPPNTSAWAEEQSIATVLRNLISNAIKFSPVNSEIIVTAAEEGEFIKVTVADQGTGIPQELEPRLFLAGEQFSTRGTQGELGTGLGLMLCKDFIQSSEGEIGYQPRPGGGSLFWFTLPMRANSTQVK